MVSTTLASITFPNESNGQIRLTVFTSGRVIAQLIGHSTDTVDVISADLATGGILATGKGGVYDTSSTATVTRYYDDFAVFTPAAEPIVLYSGRMIEIRHDSTERESSAGSVWGRPQSYRGSRFKVPPAGDANRTTRVAVKASRNDLDSAEDANLTDQITLSATVVRIYAVLPRL